MNFLEEVLTSAGTTAVDTLRENLPGIQKEATQLHDNILKFIDEVYCQHLHQSSNITKLYSKVESLVTSSTALKNNVNEMVKTDITEARTDVIKYNNELETVDVQLEFCGKLCRVFNTMKNTEGFIKSREYVHAMKEMESIDWSGLPEHKIKTELRMKATMIEQLLNYNLKKIINDNFTCMTSENKGVRENEVVISAVNNEVKEALEALSLKTENVLPLDNITRFLWEEMFMCIVQASPVMSEADGRTSFKLVVTDQKSPYKKVIQNLIAFVTFLNTHFCYDLGNGKTTIEYIGENIRDNLCELFIKQCLQDTIPNTEEELKNYDNVVKHVKLLQEILVKQGIFKEDTVSILDYANNVNVLFINKKCSNYNKQADNLIKKDLHDVVQVGVAVDPAKFSVEDFPQCSVSKNVPELLDLVQKILEKAAASPSVSAGRLYVTSENILSRYSTGVMEHHKKLLETIPQQVAIFYNNCKYICHHLDSNKWSVLLEKIYGIINGQKIDLVRMKIMEGAGGLFQTFVDKQEKQIAEIIKDTGIGSLRLCEELEPNAEKGVRQCLRQLELLKTVWQKILNYHDYNQTIGSLLTRLCTDLIEAVLRIEDIELKAVEQLTDLFKAVQTRGPKLFTEPKEINIYVESWQKMSELVFVLNAKLVEINDRWADGKGPLSLHFSPFVMKGLIRALFQNSERRAAVLAKIQDF